MAEALAGGHDTVVTIGGIQSNHCRATSTAATYLGLEPHLILRNTERGASQDPGLVGNLLVERMQGAHIHQVCSLLRCPELRYNRFVWSVCTMRAYKLNPP